MLFVGSKLTHQFDKWSLCKWFRSCIQVTKNIQQMILPFVLKLSQCKFYGSYLHSFISLQHAFHTHSFYTTCQSNRPVKNLTLLEAHLVSDPDQKNIAGFCIINFNYQLYECMYIDWIYKPGVRNEWNLPVIKGERLLYKNV